MQPKIKIQTKFEHQFKPKFKIKASLLFIDHNDSFTNNLISELQFLGVQVFLVESHDISDTLIDRVGMKEFAAIMLSPGPHSPSQFPKTLDLLNHIPPDCLVIGICLGFQILLHHFGIKVEKKSNNPTHGERFCLPSFSFRTLNENFAGLACFFNSLGAQSCSFNDVPQCELVSIVSLDGWSVAAEHVTRPWLGMQFHPESYASPIGKSIMVAIAKKIRSI